MKQVQHIGLQQFPFQWSFQTNQQYGHDIFHSHQGLEIFYLHQGGGSVICDGHYTALKPGMVLVFQPFQLHRIRFEPEEGSVRSYLVFEPAAIQSALSSYPELQEYMKKLLSYPLSFPFITELSNDHPLIQSIHLLNHHLEESTITAIAMLQCMKQIVPLTGKGKSTQARVKGHSEKAMEWIEDHIMEDIKVESVAKALHLNPNYLSTLFHKDTGCSYSDYVATRRISLARKWLMETDWQVNQIADKLGLANVSYFCQLFKKHTGYTPYQFKKQMQKAYSLIQD